MFDIPTVLTAQEILDKALRRTRKARGRGRTAIERAKSASLARIDAVTDVLRSSLKRVYSSFPRLETLPEFYRELMDILIGLEATQRALGSVRWAYEKVGEIARRSRSLIRRAQDVEAVNRGRKAFYGRVSSVVYEVDDALAFLGNARNILRKLPQIDPALPTIVVAGPPNVGKSLLVRAVSTGKPRVASYPFTTLDLSLGHFEVDNQRFQIMDTPGLLDRPIYERSDIERKALVALRRLADVIIFMLDPTTTCGIPMDQQESLLQEIRRTFPEVPLVEVENKADLGPGTGQRMRISALTGRGLQQLLLEVIRRSTSPSPAGGPQRGVE